MNLKERTQKIWETYIFGDEEGNYAKMEEFAPECVVIGTGKHEFYRNMEEFSQGLAGEMEQREDVQFQLKDFRCEEMNIAPDVTIVYGVLHVWWESEDSRISINMDTRFTMVYKKFGDDWKIVHVHQSMPNMEQADGEYYPKTLTEQLKIEQRTSDIYAALAKRDPLTGLLNYGAFEETFNQEKRSGDWFFVIDLDDFKEVNDNYGHVRGNEVLKQIAHILKKSVRSGDVVCRMGGDEFIMLCGGVSELRVAEMLVHRIIDNIASAGTHESGWSNASVGGTRIRQGDTLKEAFERADKALYDVKARGKNNWSIVI